MDDLIKRADALNLNCVITVRRADTNERKCDDEIIKACFEAYAEHIKKLPSADAVPQSEQYKKGFEDCKRAYEIELARSADAVHGEWEHWGSPFSDESEVIDTIVCSVCGARFIEPKDEPKGEYNYCPSCGAIMTPYKGGDTE